MISPALKERVWMIFCPYNIVISKNRTLFIYEEENSVIIAEYILIKITGRKKSLIANLSFSWI